VGRLERFVRKGAEAFTAIMSDAAALTKAFSAARAHTDFAAAELREEQETTEDAIGKP